MSHPVLMLLAILMASPVQQPLQGFPSTLDSRSSIPDLIPASKQEKRAVDCLQAISLSQRVDSTMVRRVDINADGQLDEVRLRVRAERFDQPFTRELQVVSGGHELLRLLDRDSLVDAFFKFNDMVPDCTGFQRCKCVWYFEQILTRTVQSTTRLGPGVFDTTRRATPYTASPGGI